MTNDDEPLWTCRDGREIPVSKLEEEHLVNIVNMLRSDPSSDSLLQSAWPIFNDLLWECISRGLMDAESGEWVRVPSLGESSTESQMAWLTQQEFKCSSDA